MFVIYMYIEGEQYRYGADNDKDKAMQIAKQVSIERQCDTYVAEE